MAPCRLSSWGAGAGARPVLRLRHLSPPATMAGPQGKARGLRVTRPYLSTINLSGHTQPLARQALPALSSSWTRGSVHPLTSPISSQKAKQHLPWSPEDILETWEEFWEPRGDYSFRKHLTEAGGRCCRCSWRPRSGCGSSCPAFTASAA